MGTRMVFGEILQRFIDKTPICVMTRITLENLFSAERMDAIFREAARKQYDQDLLFSTCVNVMCQVTLGGQPSVNAVFRKQRDQIPVSVVSLYAKLKCTETTTSEAMVRRTAEGAAKLIEKLRGMRAEPVVGFRLRMVDGNLLAGTEHRLLPLRGMGAAALPGLTVILYDYSRGIIGDLIACKDAHTNERRLLPSVLQRIEAKDLILGDRNFCTFDFLKGISQRNAAFLIRHHASVKLHWRGRRKRAGSCETGRVYQQQVRLGNGCKYRAIIIQRHHPMRDGGRRIILLTNLAVTAASAARLATLYLDRWTIEEAFRQLTEDLCCEINTLGYPEAALLAFSVAVVSYNCLACVKAALASVHGRDKVDEELSSYYVALEVKTTYQGMSVAVPATDWRRWATLDVPELAKVLRHIAQHVCWDRYKKTKRGPKKPVIKRIARRGAHVATARVLEEARGQHHRNGERRLMSHA